MKVVTKDTLKYFWGKVKTYIGTAVSTKQDTLVSGTSIKTVNNITLLGSGNIDAKELVYGKIQGTSFYSAMRNPRSGDWTFSINAETPNENKIYIDILTNIIYKYDADVGYVQIGGGDLSNYYTKTEVDTALENKQNTLTFDDVPTANSANPVKSGGVYSVLGDIETLLASI